MYTFAIVDEGVASKVAAEDRAGIILHRDGVVVVVADGAGGTAGGARAAERVVGAVRRIVDAAHALPDAEGWCRALRQLDVDLAQDRDAGETTAVVLSASPAGLAGASVGDSGAWNVTADARDDLTHAQARKPLLGTGRAVPFGFARGAWSGTLVVASDGLLKYAPHDALAELARGGDLREAAARMIDRARLPAGSLQDDVVVALVR